MSDTRRIDKITNTQLGAKKAPAYSDFYNNFDKHPHNNNLVAYSNEQCVRRSIRNILSTDYTERLFNPQFGGNLKQFLFEDISAVTSTIIRDSIKDSIGKFEPRAKVSDVLVVPNEYNNSYEVTIFFEVINSVNPQSINLTLYRVR